MAAHGPRGADDAPPTRRTLDLRGVRCPLSWAKARVVLETLPRGAELELLVDDPQAARDIPRAAEAVGHHVAAVAVEAPGWRITIEV
jgi:tRNA 2-thiouridine synthesizing protein A